MTATSKPNARSLVILVEDDVSLLSAMSFALQADGYRVLAYTDGADLLSAPPRDDVGCMVVDLQLPGMDGLELIGALRARGEVVPTILITTNPEERRRREAAAAGVAIVEKPLLDGELRRRIYEACGHDQSTIRPD